MTKITLPYSPREWQKKAEKELARFTTMVLHRRAGKTYFAVEMLYEKALFTEELNPRVVYIAPSEKQAKRVCWDYVKDWARCIPGSKIFEAELRVDLPNGGRVTLLGAENAESIRGLYMDFIVVDEVADMPADLWEDIIYPCLTDRKGGALLIGTPKGRNAFYDFYIKGKSGKRNWNSLLMNIYDTGVFDEESIEEIKEEYKGKEEKFGREFECDWDASIKGAYYGKAIKQAEKEKRITKVPYDESIPVITAWDIGFDGTSVWFVQIMNDTINVVDFINEEDKDIPYLISMVLSRNYIYDYHILPHDAKKRNIGTGKTLFSRFQSSGMKIRIAAKLSIEDGIHAVRSILSKCYFDYGRTQGGIDHLRQYHAKYDKSTGVSLSTPVHDEHSHPADGFRTLAVGLKKRHDYNNNQYSFDPINEMLFGNSSRDNRNARVNDWHPFD